jgi:hypothetical protein
MDEDGGCELLERIAVRGALVAGVVHEPAPHAHLGFARQLATEEAVDALHLLEGIPLHVAVPDVEEAVWEAGVAQLHAAGEGRAELLPLLAPGGRWSCRAA